MPSLAVIRDKYLNPWDVGNYYGVINHGVDLYVCGTGNEPQWDTIKQLYPKAHVIKYTRPWEPLELETDIIDVPDPHYAFSQYFVKRHPKTIVVGWDNIPGKNSFNSNALYALWSAWKYVARSTLARETLIWDGADPKKIKVIPGAIDTEFFKPDDKPRENAVLFVGRLILEKGLLDLIWAMQAIPAELWIAGTGDKEYFERWVKKAGIEDRTRWLGFLDRNALAETYRRAKVLCVPSIPKLDVNPYACWLEQFGQVFIEAMASGLPIVSTLSGAIGEVTAAGPMLVPPRDWRQLRFKLNKLLFNDKQWKKYSRSVRSLAEKRYAQDVVGKQIKEWYFE